MNNVSSTELTRAVGHFNIPSAAAPSAIPRLRIVAGSSPTQAAVSVGHHLVDVVTWPPLRPPRPITVHYTPTTSTTRFSFSSQVNSASYPQRDGKWVVAYGLRGEGLAFLIGAVVCLLAANRGSNCSLTQRAMDGRIVRCGVISSCQSAATSEIVKRFWSCTHVRSAITRIRKRCINFTFTFTFVPFDATSFEAGTNGRTGSLSK